MNTKYFIVIAIVAIAIILGSVAAYVYSLKTLNLSSNNNSAGCRSNLPISIA